MAGMFVNQGEQIFLKAGLNHTAPQNLTITLFTSNIADAATNTESTYAAALASGNGLDAKTLTGGSWTVTTDGNGKASATYTQQSFDYTGSTSVTCYGYVIKQVTSGLLVASENFGAKTVTASGDSIKITPTITLG